MVVATLVACGRPATEQSNCVVVAPAPPPCPTDPQREPKLVVAEPGLTEIDAAERLSDEARSAFERSQFSTSAVLFASALAALSENEPNREQRDSLLLVTVEAYRVAVDSGEAPPEIVFDALRIAREYEREFASAYGQDAPLSPEARGAIATLEQRACVK